MKNILCIQIFLYLISNGWTAVFIAFIGFRIDTIDPVLFWLFISACIVLTIEIIAGAIFLLVKCALCTKKRLGYNKVFVMGEEDLEDPEKYGKLGTEMRELIKKKKKPTTQQEENGQETGQETEI